MKKILLLLILSMITACSFGDPNGGGGSSGSIDMTALHLGNNFAIDSLSDHKFINQTGTLNYTADKVLNKNQNTEDIVSDLKSVIYEQLRKSNYSNYLIQDPIINGSITENKMLVIKYPVDVSDMRVTGKRISVTYAFTITFEGEHIAPVLELYLGNDFTIPSLEGATFESGEAKLTYHVYNAAMANVNKDDIRDQLELAINQVHAKNTRIEHQLQYKGTSYSSGYVVIRYAIRLTELADRKNTIAATYSFTIYFRDPPPPPALDFYLGDRFSITTLQGKYFTSNKDDPFKYNVDNIDRGNIENPSLIVEELTTSINTLLGQNSSILHELSDPAIENTIAANRTLVIDFPIKLTEDGDESNSNNGTYSFTIIFAEKYIPPAPLDLSFYLGDNFKIKSTDYKPFTIIDNLSYSVSNIDSDRIEVYIPTREVEAAVIVELNKNSAISYTVGRINEVWTTKDVTSEIPIEITDKNYPENTIKGVYIFKITFIKPIVNIEFNHPLSPFFAISSIDGILFDELDGNPLNYNTKSNIVPDGKNIDLIKTQLMSELEKELSPLNKNYHFWVVRATHAGTIARDSKLIVTVEVIIDDKRSVYPRQTIYYSFTINFKGNPIPWDGSTTRRPTVSFNNDYLIISEASQLAWLINNIIYNSDVKLVDNIDMGNNPFPGISKFEGIFYGNNKEIRNLNILTTDNTPAALIKTITGDTTIQNLTLKDGTVTGQEKVAAFIGVAQGFKITIENSTTNLALTINSALDSHHYIGGLIAVAHSTIMDIINSSNTGVISSKITSGGSNIIIGGLIGYYYDGKLNINRARNTGNITNHSKYNSKVGGLVGSLSDAVVTIDNSTNKASVTNTDNGTNANTPIYTGGLIGYDINGQLEISHSNNTGMIKNNSHYGYTAGIIGGKTGGTLNLLSIFNKGEVFNSSIAKSYAGGLIGSNSSDSYKIENSYNSGKITAIGSTSENYAGGLISNNNAFSNIKNSFNYADIYATTAHTFIANGGQGANYISVYTYSPDTTPDAPASSKLSAEEFKSKKSFDQWDFTTNWTLSTIGKNYPTLINNPE